MPSDMLAAAKQMSVAGMLATPEFLYGGPASAMMMEMGNAKFGTAMMSLAQVFHGGKLTPKSYDEMAALHLAGPVTYSMDRDPATGKMKRTRHEGSVYDLDLMGQNP